MNKIDFFKEVKKISNLSNLRIEYLNTIIYEDNKIIKNEKIKIVY